MKIYSLQKGVSAYSLILQETVPPNLNPFLLVQGRVLRVILTEPERAGLLRRKRVLCRPTVPETKAEFFSWSAFSQQRWQLSFCCCFEPC